MNDNDLDDIKTGNGIDRDLAATTNDRLKKTVIELRKFILTISDFNKQSSNQTDQVIKLTKRIVYLTIAMLFGLVVQILIAIFKG